VPPRGGAELGLPSCSYAITSAMAASTPALTARSLSAGRCGAAEEGHGWGERGHCKKGH
jgi:hypothetical protein